MIIDPPRKTKDDAPTHKVQSLKKRAICLAVVGFAVGLAAPAAAQEAPKAALSSAPAPDQEAAREITFEADVLAYDSDQDVVTASGNVVLRSDQKSAIAKQVTWNRKSGQIIATGDVRFVDEAGDQLFTDRLELNDKFEVGAMDNLLLALREGGRLAAKDAARGVNGDITLQTAVYSACALENAQGCPRNPSWRVTAKRVIYDPKEKRVTFKGAFLELFGARILPLPGLAFHTDGRAVSGILIPDFQVSQSNGVEVNANYYLRLADNADLNLGAYVFSAAPPMGSAQFRHLTGNGAYQITGYATESQRISGATGAAATQRDFRGYIEANGRFQFSPEWSLTASIRRASDRTFLRRYDISRDDRLRSTFNLERIGEQSYLSIAGWSTQTLRLGQSQGQIPVALPVIDYRRRLPNPVLGGTVDLQLNSLNLMRDSGQNTQRAFASAQWDLRTVTGLGQVVTFTALARGDIYHSSQNDLTSTAFYRGDAGWQGRGIALAAIDMQWPFVGRAFGGTQVLIPRIQIVATPQLKNLAVPNEDSRAIDLEDSNLFALNRFPGYDRFEDGTRVTYGFDWELQRPGWRFKTSLGQSYRLADASQILVNGTGLSGRLSDFVGRTEVRYKDFIKLTHRYRLDKDNLALRRNEFDATIGSRQTYAEIGYLKLNRNIDTSIEDLRDREELRAAARVAFARYWSMFGSGVFNLTKGNADPALNSNGFDPVRTRLGLGYQDDCLEFGLTWRRDYITSGDARRGDTFQIYFALRNLGFR